MKNFHFFIILILGFLLRLYYLFFNAGDLSLTNLGGDPCHHYNIAYNIAKGLGPKTSYIFSYWFQHENIPALTDVYPPGFHYFGSLFLIMINEHYFSARMANFFISILTIIITYFLGKKIHSKTLGLIAMFMISFNYFHIENSTVFMTVNFYSFLVAIFFYVLLVLPEKNQSYLKHLLLGFIVGYSSISFGAWQILLIIYLFYCYKYYNFNFHTIYLFFFLSFAIFFLPWAIKTYNYFDVINYSNQKFYLYWKWGDMMNSKSPPNFSEFLNQLNIVEFVLNHIKWSLKNIIKFCLALFPTFIFYLSFLLIPLALIGFYSMKKKTKLLLFFTIFYFCAMSLASYANGGILYFRHFMPFLLPVSILTAVGIFYIFSNFLIKKLTLNYKYFIYCIYILAFTGTIFGFESKTTFWQRDAKPFYEFSEKIKTKVPFNERIMYGLTPSDLWCSTKRQIVQDPVFLQSRNPKRAIEEIERYKVKFLFLDLSNHIYDRTQETLETTLEYYKGIKLKLILSDKKNSYYLYKILD